ncbi:MAG: hypothetical protein D6725_03775 [Planctomycetota bacterium]|nr:MAG: hypothetical protein D6725_03775 [Planctomycetota bacterium]
MSDTHPPKPKDSTADTFTVVFLLFVLAVVAIAAVMASRSAMAVGLFAVVLAGLALFAALAVPMLGLRHEPGKDEVVDD